MEQSNQSYLVTEKVSKLMGKYAVPCIISLLVGALYNIVDQIFIANADYLGSYGNAANTVVFPLTVIALGIAVMIGDGCCAFVSQSLGAGRTEDAHKSVGNAVLLCIVSSVVLTAVYLIFAEPILTFFGGKVNNETFALAGEYFFWIALGVPFYVFGQAMNPVIRSDGSPKFAMLAILAGAITNIILDPIFIYPLRMGMKGAALATILGQIFTALLSLWYICHMKSVKLGKSSFGFSGSLIRKFLLLGLTSFLAQISLVLSMAAVQNMCTKYGAMDEIFGQAEYAQIPLAVLGIVMKFFQIAISISIGLAAGCIPIAGFNIGARRKDRAKELFSYLLIAEVIVALAATVIVELFPRQLIGIFGAGNESIYYTEFAIKSFRIYLCMMVPAMVNKGTFIYMQALGKAFASTVVSMTREIILGVFLPIILPIFMGLDGILYSFPAADILTFIIALYFILATYKELSVQTMTAESDMGQAVIKVSSPGVIITIAREHGSSGKQIGQLLAEKLGIPFYYKETTALAAQESGLAQEFISDINKNSPEVLRSLYLSTDVAQHAIAAQDKIIRKIADSGSCVIVGRAADYVLRDYDNLVRVFIYAPEEYKIKRVMEIYGDTAWEAQKNVRRSDSARAIYYQTVSGEVWGNPHGYELCIDASIGKEVAANIIFDYIKKTGL